MPKTARSPHRPPFARRLTAALAGLVLLSGLAQGARNNFQLDAEPPGRPEAKEGEKWAEGQVPLPPWPADGDLVEIRLDTEFQDIPFRFFVDARNIHIDRAGDVVRYTVVAESPSGTRNLTYEGIRCTMKGAYKVYAYGSGKSFVPAPRSDWLPIPNIGSEAYRADLYRNRFCVSREPHPRKIDEILRALHDRAPNRDGTGFQAD
jgi:hypothetical protein